MSKILIIAEKPSMGMNIAQAIAPDAKKQDGFLQNEKYFITWAYGHLIALAEPQSYNPKYEKWNLEDLPLIPGHFKTEIKEKKQVKIIKELAEQSSLIINACDCAREGELIFGRIYQTIGSKLPVKRLWTSTLTPSGIKQAFNHLKDGKEMLSLLASAESRAKADWLIGLNSTRAFTAKYGEMLSIGRVQSPVLAMIYDRTKAIENFKVETYFVIEGHFKQGTTEYKGIWQGEKIFDKQKAEIIANKVNGKTGHITQYKKKNTTESAPKLYDLTLLQREANTKYGFTAKKTLDVAQSLYEKHKAITYPRTNSNYVTQDEIPFMKNVLRLLKSDGNELAIKADGSLVTTNSRICNPKKVEDHHALLITDKFPNNLSKDEQIIYDLILHRFLAQFFPPAEYIQHEIMTEVEQEHFKTSIKQLKSPGWKEVYGAQIDESNDDENEEMKLSFDLDEKSSVTCKACEAKEKQTQPPKPHSEASLLAAMETAGKELSDDEMRDLMKESGIGTPATRSGIIERLKSVGYLNTKGKTLVITKKGISLIESIRNIGLHLLTSAEMTGTWEKRLNYIAKGQEDPEGFMQNIVQLTNQIVDTVKAMENVQNTSFKNTIATCPSCQQGEIVEGKKAFGCLRWKEGCNFKIWKEAYGKKLNESQIKSLIEKGETGYIKFKSKQGKEYQAKLKMKDKTTGELELEFKPKEESKELGTCPKCSEGHISDRGKFYGCTNYPSCDFTLPKKMLEKTIPKQQIEKILTDKRTDKISGFKSKKGKEFEAYLVLDSENKLDFKFN